MRRSRYQNRRTFEATGAQISKRLISLPKWVAGGLHRNTDPRRNLQELNCVLPCKIGDGYQLALLPNEAIGKTGKIAHMNTGTDDPAALADSSQSPRHEIANRRIDDGRIERFGCHRIGAARPCNAEASGKGLR